MFWIAGIVALGITGQVPPPSTASDASRPLRLERDAILREEAAALKTLADRLEKDGLRDAAGEARRLATPPAEVVGVRRFVPLPEVDVPPIEADSTPVVPAAPELKAIRTAAASRLFKLATRAATEQPRHYALADSLLREVLEREPDHTEARRLLGFVPHHKGWATPYAVRQFAIGNTLHPTYGWVKRSWIPQLENGLLPGKVVAGEPTTWLPAPKADALRKRYASGWQIDTEHFHIRTNVPLAEAIAFGRSLEHLHELFESHFADVIGERLPLARRFRGGSTAEEEPDRRHDVSYFASRKEFNDYLRPYEGPGIAKSLGIYFPPGVLPRSSRGHAFFFRDLEGDLPVTATLYHEVSHQLLWESGIAGAEDYLGNEGNYWVFEGLGTYFETLLPQPDGSILIGGLVGPRNVEARTTLIGEGRLVPLERFVGLDKRAFNHRVEIYRHYQQASALTSYLLHGDGEAHREAFLDYVRDAAQGRIRRRTGLSLADRLGRSYEEIEAAFQDYLKGPS